jgi:hypothetical protein
LGKYKEIKGFKANPGVLLTSGVEDNKILVWKFLDG